MARLDEQRITDALNHAEPVNKKTMDSLTELTSYPDLPAEDVTVIPVTIRYKDAPEETYDVLFSEQDTENLNIDDSICFSGYSHKELTEMVGRETHEDFDVISVGAPYKVHATQVKRMPRKRPMTCRERMHLPAAIGFLHSVPRTPPFIHRTSETLPKRQGKTARTFPTSSAR